jgi:hypothetical protein
MKTDRSIQKIEKDAPRLSVRLCLSTENPTLIQENRKRNPLKFIPTLKFQDQNPQLLEKMPINRIETSARGAYDPHR